MLKPAAALCAGLVLLGASAPAMYRGDAAHGAVYAGTPGSYYAGVRWRYQTAGAVRSSPALYDGNVYVGSSDGHLYALRAMTGALLWRFDAKSAVTSSPAVDGANVYFQAQNNTIYAIARRDGSLRWSHRTGSDVPLAWGYESGDYWTASPSLANGVLYAGSGDGYVYALQPQSGRVLWKAKTGGRIRSAPAIADGTAYVGSYDGKLYAFDTKNGSLRWRFSTQGASLNSAEYGYDRRSIQSSPSVGDGAVYFGAKDGSLYAVEQRTGALRWRRTGNVYWYMSAPAFDRHIVFTGNSDGRFIQALDTRTGAIVWQFNAGINVFASPSIAAGVVYTGAWDGQFHALDERTGKELWSFSTLGRRIFSSAAMAGDSTYFGADDGGIYAVRSSATRALARAVFYDASLDGYNTVPQSQALRDFLHARGYQTLDAASLRAFLSRHLHDPGGSVVVSAMDAIPQGIDIRPYLRAGGKIVWVGNPPTLWSGKPLAKRSLSDLNRTLPRKLIGVSFERGNFDPMTAFVTAEGQRWGLSGSWLSNWSADPQSVSTVLARDEQGLAAAWVRSYGGPPGTGFVQIPMLVSPQNYPLNLFAIAIAAEHLPG